MNQAKMLNDEAFKSLRAGDSETFNRLAGGHNRLDFTGTNLRGVDFRHADLSKVILRDAYMRDADLRGVDLSQHDLSGVSINNAKVSGCLFPANIDASEIRLSLEHGTRMRIRHST